MTIWKLKYIYVNNFSTSLKWSFLCHYFHFEYFEHILLKILEYVIECFLDCGIFIFIEWKDLNIYFPFDCVQNSYAISLSAQQRS